MTGDVLQILQPASGQVVHDHHRFAVRQQPLDQVRADKASATGDEDMGRGRWIMERRHQGNNQLKIDLLRACAKAILNL